MFKNQEDKLWEGIHKKVRPTANILPEKYKIKCNIYERLERIANDN
jgi:hypothetical protein